MILSNESFWHVLFHAGVNEKKKKKKKKKKAFQTTCGSYFETKLLNYEDNLYRMTIHEK